MKEIHKRILKNDRSIYGFIYPTNMNTIRLTRNAHGMFGDRKLVNIEAIVMYKHDNIYWVVRKIISNFRRIFHFRINLFKPYLNQSKLKPEHLQSYAIELQVYLYIYDKNPYVLTPKTSLNTDSASLHRNVF